MCPICFTAIYERYDDECRPQKRALLLCAMHSGTHIALKKNPAEFN